MTRPEITELLNRTLENRMLGNGDTRIYWAKEVTFDYATDHAVRVDYMRFEPLNNTVSGIEKGDFFCYEIKSSVEDFKSPHGHNMIGDYNYYVMPKDVFEKVKDSIPFGVGIYCLEDMSEDTGLKLIRKARRMSRTRPIAEMLLMMFRSANRENIKAKKEERDK